MDNKINSSENYPEHEKLNRGGEFQAISNFIGFLEEQGYELTRSTKHNFEIDIAPQNAMYHYFDVNISVLEKERRAMVKSIKP